MECVFSVCGLLTEGHQNRMTKSPEMQARLKLNAKVKYLHERITITMWIAEIRHTVTFNCAHCNMRVKLKLKWF